MSDTTDTADSVRALVLIKTNAVRNDATTTKEWLEDKDYVENIAVLWGDFDVFAIIKTKNMHEFTRIVLTEIQAYEHVLETRVTLFAADLN